ncbi:unnamed protein product [Ectocarpus fasciculatus]
MSETLQVQFPQGSHGKDLGGGASDNGEGGGVDDDDDDHDHSWSDEEDRDDSSSSSSCASCSSSSSDDDNSGGGESGDRALGSRKKKKRLGGGHRRHRRGETTGMPPLGSDNPALSSVPGGDVGKQQAGLRISGGGGGGLLPGGKGRGTDAGVGSTWVHRPRLALHGPPGCGQTQLAAAALHLLDGVPVHSLALHSLHGDPSRTAEASLVSRFVEARRNVPSVLYLPGAHQWWDGEDEAAAVHPHLRTLLINLLDDIPDTWPILVVSTWETKPEDGGNGGGGGSALGDYSYNMAASASRSGSSKQLISALLGGSRAEEGPWGLGVSGGGGAWGGGGAAGGGGSVDVYGEEGERVGWNGAIEMTLTGDKQREGFAEEMLSTLAGTLRKAFCARGSRGGRAKKTPPPPLPLAPLPERQEEREEPEDESLKKQEEHYLRELRICLREVLGELRKDRRFSMFKQIGDYEGEFMDLNGIRDKLNAEEYVTLDDFEEDLKLMAEEAKEVRDRLKANLARAEANASALEGARGAAASEGAAGGGGAPGGAGRGSGAGGGDDVGLRRALMEVDRATNQLARAATAVDMACFLRDAALSFLQDCVSRLGYDLEGKCKDIAARKKARGNGGSSGGRAGGRSSPASGKRSATAAAGRGDDGGGSSRSAVAPNYTSESVIEDIYGGVAAQQTGTGSRDRATRASRRSASSDGRFVQLGDRGKLLEQGTEVEVVPPPAKRAARQQRSPAKRRVMFDKGDGEEGGEQEGQEQQAPAPAPAVTVSTAEEQGKTGEGGVGGQPGSVEGAEEATTSAPATVEPPLAASLVDSGSASEGSCTPPGSHTAVAAAPKDATVAAAPAPAAVAPTLPALDTAHGGDEEQQDGDGKAVSSATNPAAEEEEEEPRPALVVPSPEAAANGSTACVNLAAASIPSRGAAPSVAADAAGGAELEQRRQEGPTQAVVAANEAFPLGSAADGDGDALMKDVPVTEAAAAAAAVDAGSTTQASKTSGSTPLAGPAGDGGGCDGGVATALAPAAAVTAAEAAGERGAVGTAAATSSSSSNGAPSAAAKAQTEALAAEEAVKAATAAAAATRQQAKADRKRAKRACEEACARLLETRASVAARTHGWSVEQLLALRGGALELGAALCGRGMPRAKAASASDAVDVVLRYIDRRLPR